MKLRPVTIEDADLLLKWRNDPQTRMASLNTEEVKTDEHVSWLRSSLDNPGRKLFIAEEDGVPVGTVRADYCDGVCKLSWTVAPSARGRGVGKRMVSLLASQITVPIRAEIKVENKASIRIAEYVGMECVREDNGVLHYRRAALKQVSKHNRGLTGEKSGNR